MNRNGVNWRQIGHIALGVYGGIWLYHASVQIANLMRYLLETYIP